MISWSCTLLPSWIAGKIVNLHDFTILLPASELDCEQNCETVGSVYDHSHRLDWNRNIGWFFLSSELDFLRQVECLKFILTHSIGALNWYFLFLPHFQTLTSTTQLFSLFSILSISWLIPFVSSVLTRPSLCYDCLLLCACVRYTWPSLSGLLWSWLSALFCTPVLTEQWHLWH